MIRFGPDPQSFFDAVYRGIPPWDIGAPQPAMQALLAAYPPASPILDVGCATGDLSLYLAKLGHQVLGVDFVASAIAEAQEKARLLPPTAASQIEFIVADALKPTLLRQSFGAVVDSGFLHLLDPSESDSFIGEVARVLSPGGRYYLHEFAVEFPVPNVPRSVSAVELLARFTPEKGWRILELQPVTFLSRVAPPTPAICACLERLPLPVP